MADEQAAKQAMCGRIAQVLAESGLPQAAFAKRLGVSQSFVSAVVRGTSGPSIEMLTALRGAFDVDLDWLLTGSRRPDAARPPPARPVGIDDLLKEVERQWVATKQELDHPVIAAAIALVSVADEARLQRVLGFLDAQMMEATVPVRHQRAQSA